MIVKVQRALNNNNNVLIYNEDRSVLREGPITEEVSKFMGTDLKIFASAHMEGTEIVLDQRCDRPDWDDGFGIHIFTEKDNG